MNLAMKYRPQSFDQVVGQSVVIKTLNYALANDTLKKSIILAGLHGVGKTTLARLLGKRLQCSDIDIIEVDAASHTGVDAARKLIAMSRQRPQGGPAKLFIIDEAHRLSQQAWDVFLKPLEDGNDWTYYVFCTTEYSKLPATIISRSLIFMLRAIRFNDIIKQLQTILIKEKVDYNDSILRTIARKAEGSMRDALSLTDKLLAFSQNNLNKPGLAESLGELDGKVFMSLASCFIKGDIDEAMLQINDIFKRGVKLKTFLESLSMYFRDLFMIKSPKTETLLEHLDDRSIAIMKAQSKALGRVLLLHFLSEINKTLVEFDLSHAKKLKIELLVIKLISDVKRVLFNKK